MDSQGIVWGPSGYAMNMQINVVVGVGKPLLLALSELFQQSFFSSRVVVGDLSHQHIHLQFYFIINAGKRTLEISI